MFEHTKVGVVAVLLAACGSSPLSEQKVSVGRDRVPVTWRDRNITCDIPNKPASRTFADGLLAGESIEYFPTSAVDYNDTNWPNMVASSWNKLDFINPAAVKIAVIDIRNVEGVPHYHYFSNGTWNSRNQNWSSTKFLGQLAALHKIRLVSDGRMGTDSYINDIGVGIGSRRFTYHSYRLHHDSWNTAGGLFKQIAGLYPVNGGEYNPTAFVRGWLSRPAALFNGYYGDSNYDGFYTLRKGSPSSSNSVSFSVPTRGAVARTANLLSPLTLAESWKRIGVNFRDDALMPKGTYGANFKSYAYFADSGSNNYLGDDSAFWKTAITPEDIADLFYGQNDGSVGGALHDIGIRTRFNAAFGGDQRLDRATNGKWRIFGKTGSGRNDRAYGAYVCLPEYKGGREFALFLVSKRGTAAASDAIAKVMDTFAPGIRTGNPEPGADPDFDADPVCQDPPAAFRDNQSFRLVHGQQGRYKASIVIDQSSPRKTIDNVLYQEKFFVKHSDDDISNIAFNYDNQTGSMSGKRYNISWNPDAAIDFEAQWECNSFVGEFVSGNQREPLKILNVD